MEEKNVPIVSGISFKEARENGIYGDLELIARISVKNSDMKELMNKLKKEPHEVISHKAQELGADYIFNFRYYGKGHNNGPYYALAVRVKEMQDKSRTGMTAIVA